MLIGERAESVSLPPKTIRYDEEVGLLPPPERRPNGYREACSMRWQYEPSRRGTARPV